MANERVPFVVAGVKVTIDVRYKAGHQLTALEASALEQTRRENIRNGVAKAVKEKPNEAQRLVDEYAAKYEFSKRGGQRLDPVLAEAKKLAKQQIDSKLAERGMSKKEFAAYDDRVAKLMQHPKILEIAKSVVAQRKVQQDIVDDKSRKQSTPTDNTDDGQMSLQNGLDNGLRQTRVLRSISIIAKALNAMVARVRRFGQRGLVASNGERTAA